MNGYKECINYIVGNESKMIVRDDKALMWFVDGKFFTSTIDGDTYGEITNLVDLSTGNWQPYTDWSKVKIDTPTWVREKETNKWMVGHFAEIEGGMVFCFSGGRTSHTSSGMTIGLKYATLTNPNEGYRYDLYE